MSPKSQSQKLMLPAPVLEVSLNDTVKLQTVVSMEKSVMNSGRKVTSLAVVSVHEGSSVENAISETT